MMHNRTVSWMGPMAILCACGRSDPAPRAASTGASPAPLSADPAVVVEKPLDLLVTLPGELTPFDAVEIFSRANGFVRRLPVDRGSIVHKGDVLAQLDAPELTSQRVEADARVSGDQSTVQRLEAADQKAPGAVAGHDIELAKAALRASAARQQSLRALEGYLTILAPFDGVVTERSVSVGALVGPPSGGRGTPMLKMESVAKLRLTVAVPEDKTSGVVVGDALEFTVRAWPQRRFKGAVVRFAHAVDVRTRTMPVELDVENADRVLSAGMYAMVAWHVRRPTPSFFVPDSAVVQATDRTFVVRVRDGKADPVVVQRGLANAGLVEVFGELHAGDVVAKRGSEEMKAGVSVSLRPAASASTAAPNTPAGTR